MPMSNRFIRRDRVTDAAPMPMETFGNAFSTPGGRNNTTGQGEMERVFEAGYQAGIKAATARMQTERTADLALRQALDREFTRHGDELASHLLQLATEIAQQVTRTQVHLHPENILGVIREALQLLRDDTTPIRILLHPDDAALIEKNMGVELQQRRCRIIADVKFARGDCRVESGLCDVDATLATRWKRVLQPLGVEHGWID